MLSTKTGGDEVYLQQLDAVLPRLLAMADRDPLSKTLGVGDRQYWAWKLIDFPNATFQGAAHGFAALLAHDLFSPAISHSSILSRINAAFEGTRRVTRPSGHLEEALPFERSFCVTALVAYDLLRALEELQRSGFAQSISAPERILGPLIRALVTSDESHGFISNHLATAAAALFRWHELCGDGAAQNKATLLLKRILDHQSSEGWFVEYGGADPGYQTLCVSYLADVWRVTKDERLHDALAASARFLTHFAHPDGSYGGTYGSRATRLYYPAGVAALAPEFADAAALARFMRDSIRRNTTVPLTAIDQPNLVPLFNNYVRAACAQPAFSESLLPCETRTHSRVHLKQAGLLIDSGAAHHTVISTHKGGVIHHLSAGTAMQIDSGVACQDARGRLYTNQSFDATNAVVVDGDHVSIVSDLRRLPQHYPNHWNFLVLRVLSATVMRAPMLAELVKRILAKLLITGARRSVGTVRRRIELGTDLNIEDAINADQSITRIRLDTPFSSIHMASQGYWQLQDDSEANAL